MLVIPGARALSPFRLRKLAADIDAAGLDAEVQGGHWYLGPASKGTPLAAALDL